MSKELQQYRYIYEKEKGFSETILNSIKKIQSDSEGAVYIKSFYIQTLPGVMVTLNGEKIKIGATGVYEIEPKCEIVLETFSIDDTSIEMIQKNVEAYFIINLIYEEG